MAPALLLLYDCLLSTYAIPIELIMYTVIRNIHLVYQFKHKPQNSTVYSQFKALYYYSVKTIKTFKAIARFETYFFVLLT